MFLRFILKDKKKLEKKKVIRKNIPHEEVFRGIIIF